MKKNVLFLAFIMAVSTLQLVASTASTAGDFNVLSSEGTSVVVPRSIINAVPYLQRLKDNSGFTAPQLPFNAVQLGAIFDTIQAAVDNAVRPERKGILGKIKDKFKSAATSEETLVSSLADTLADSGINEIEVQAQVIENFKLPVLTRAFARRIAKLDRNPDTQSEFRQIVNSLAGKMFISRVIDTEYQLLYGLSLTDARVRGGLPVLFEGATSSTAGKTVSDLLDDQRDGIKSYNLREIELDPMNATVFGSQGIKLYELDLSGRGLVSLKGITQIPNIEFVRTLNLSNNPSLTIPERILRDLQSLDQLQMINIQGTQIKPGSNAILFSGGSTIYL